jgi:uncharacterized membrane protein
VHVPALSTYLLIAWAIFDIFLFIYFLHYITQSVKYETIIHRIYEQTLAAMKQSCTMPTLQQIQLLDKAGLNIAAPATGIFQGFDEKSLLKTTGEEGSVISFLHPPGTFVLCGTPLAVLFNGETFSKAHTDKIQQAITIQRGQDIDNNYYYGFRQLMEVAVKALSPGINDPGTAVLCLQALASLLAHRLRHFPEIIIKDDAGNVRIIVRERTVGEIATECLLPIWDYGKKDRAVQQAFLHSLTQLQACGKVPEFERIRLLVTEAAQNK